MYKRQPLIIGRNGSEFLRVTSGGNVGINRTDPDQKLNVSGCAEFNAYDSGSGAGGYYTTKGLIIGNLYDAGKSYTGSDDRTACIWQERGLDLDFATNDALRMKITYNGEVLIGHTSPSSLSGGFTKALAIEGTGAANSSIGLTRNADDDNPPYIYFGKSRGSAPGANNAITNGDHIGMVNFAGAKGSGSFGESVNLRTNADASFTSTSTPGRFSIWTTPVGSTGTLESFQVNSAGAVTTPRNVAFSYRRGGSLGSWGSATGITYPTLPYRSPLPLFGSGSADYDTHSSLSTFSSGGGTGMKFTAPVDGKYMVVLNMTSVRCHVQTDWGSIGLMVNTTSGYTGGSLDYMLDTKYTPDQSGSGTDQFGWGGSVIINLSQNDYIVPYVMSCENWSADNMMSFMGYLLG